jgi:hypothetical protein
MAGQSHWSASYEARSDEKALVLDWACRLSSLASGKSGFLGTTYRVGNDVTCRANGEGLLCEQAGIGLRCRITPTHGRIELDPDNKLVRVVPLVSKLDDAKPGKQSPRWAIRIE